MDRSEFQRGLENVFGDDLDGTLNSRLHSSFFQSVRSQGIPCFAQKMRKKGNTLPMACGGRLWLTDPMRASVGKKNVARRRAHVCNARACVCGVQPAMTLRNVDGLDVSAGASWPPFKTLPTARRGACRGVTTSQGRRSVRVLLLWLLCSFPRRVWRD